MQGRVRWQRIITLANLVVAALVILVLFGTLLALSALAPEISSWQLLTLLAIGVPISVVGLWLTKNLGSCVGRWLGLIINGAAIAFFPRSGTIGDSTGCTVKYEEFYVGTKAYLLSGYAKKDTDQILKGRCSGAQR